MRIFINMMIFGVLILFSSGCRHSLQYKSFGSYNPKLQSKIVSKYHQIKEFVSLQKVKIYSHTFPPGIKYENGIISVTKNSTRQALGSFKWRGVGLLPSRKESYEELAKIAKASGGNEMVITKIRTYKGHLISAEGVILLHKQ